MTPTIDDFGVRVIPRGIFGEESIVAMIESGCWRVLIRVFVGMVWGEVLRRGQRRRGIIGRRLLLLLLLVICVIGDGRRSGRLLDLLIRGDSGRMLFRRRRYVPRRIVCLERRNLGLSWRLGLCLGIRRRYRRQVVGDGFRIRGIRIVGRRREGGMKISGGVLGIRWRRGEALGHRAGGEFSGMGRRGWRVLRQVVGRRVVPSRLHLRGRSLGSAEINEDSPALQEGKILRPSWPSTNKPPLEPQVGGGDDDDDDDESIPSPSPRLPPPLGDLQIIPSGFLRGRLKRALGSPHRVEAQ